MKRVGALAIAVVLQAGCAGMADTMSKAAGLGVVTEERSTFDNATIINSSPAFLYSQSSWGNMVKLGARWSSAAPDKVALILAYDSNISSGGAAYIGIKSIQINIDGKVSSYVSSSATDLSGSGYNSISKTIYTSSKNSIVIPYEVLRQMVSARDCRLRIHTSKGYEDAQFSIERIPGGQGTAIIPIRELMSRVSAVLKN